MTSPIPTSAVARQRHDPAGGETDPASRLEPLAWPLFAGAALSATVLVLYLGRGRTFSADEMTWFMQTPDLGLGGALEPHVGHLILTSRLIYDAVYSTLGVGYLPFQVLTMAMVVLTAGLLVAYAGRRVGKIVAVAPALILLVFGSDADHLLAGNGFTVVGALACGLGALLALDRDDRRGDMIACGLLCLGVVTYTVALAFVVGVGVSILLGRDRWRRIWIVAAPVAIYGAWWLWALGSSTSSEGQIVLTDVTLFPSWAFQSLSGALSALAGLDFPFGNDAPELGPTLALLALIALAWRFRAAPASRMLWTTLAIALTLWMMGAISRSVSEFLMRTPDSSRYLFPSAVVVLITAACAAAGVRWSRSSLLALFLIATVGAATNIALARQAGASSRAESMLVRADLAAIDIAGANADPSYVPAEAPLPIAFSFTDGRTSGTYLAAAARYGGLGYSPEELRASAEPFKQGADVTLAGALGLALRPAAERPSGDVCLELGPGADRVPSVELAPGGSVALESKRPAAIQVRRFAGVTGVDVGEVAPGEAQALSVPADPLPDPWRLTSDAPVRACVTP